ncbi:MAG: glutamate--tRNA ligase, partial [Candidatus Aenigmatarchaeota archaeon]
MLRKEFSEVLIEKRKREEERKLPPLPNADKYEEIRTRFAPNPDSVLHLGSARAIILSHDYARMYNGKFILRFEDTDPRLKRANLIFYNYIREDLRWLNCKWDEEYIQSDRLELYYKVARELIERGGGYVCTCPKDRFRELIASSKPCPCRNLSIGAHLDRWEKMLNGTYDEEEAVLRVKTDLH